MKNKYQKPTNIKDETMKEGGSLVIIRLEDVIGTQWDITEEWKLSERKQKSLFLQGISDPREYLEVPTWICRETFGK